MGGVYSRRKNNNHKVEEVEKVWRCWVRGRRTGVANNFNHERHGLTTDGKGRSIPVSLLRETDAAGYEVCRFGNRLHAMYGNAGIIDVTKKDLKDAEGRAARHGELPEELRGQEDLLLVRAVVNVMGLRPSQTPTEIWTILMKSCILSELSCRANRTGCLSSSGGEILVWLDMRH
jgi:hypothetical protein